jgi:hypothetical protein
LVTAVAKHTRRQALDECVTWEVTFSTLAALEDDRSRPAPPPTPLPSMPSAEQRRKRNADDGRRPTRSRP